MLNIDHGDWQLPPHLITLAEIATPYTLAFKRLSYYHTMILYNDITIQIINYKYVLSLLCSNIIKPYNITIEQKLDPTTPFEQF